ncbi:aspartate aminotransferase family protein [Citricoccus sp. GCM10030269]|uniref:aspartate aminotransferase family protein n=1 Tax=Citricoccus sp. GCM10030269 TaxID=3273388 RepID=UPI003614E993
MTENSEMTPQDRRLLERRGQTIGPYSPLFYNRPRHFVSGDGVWLTDVEGRRYLDGYNNVPQVGHSNPRVAEAVYAQMSTYNVHTRYLSEHVVDYAEQLLATFDDRLDRVYFTNSGSESNDLALRIARHHTGRDGIIVTDHSYHGNTISLAALTTGLEVSEPFGEHVRTISVPDLDDSAGTTPEDLLAKALAGVDAAIASLRDSGHGVSALLFDPSFSTEGLPRLPEQYLAGVTERVRTAGGLVISDEVQAGLGRLGDHWWGHQATGIAPDLVTLGKPLGNGYPVGGVVTTHELMDDFSSANMYFNTFAGTPASAAAGRAVLAEVRDRDLVARSGDLGRHVAQRLQELVDRHPQAAAAKGRGLFFGLSLIDDQGQPDPALAKRIVEALVDQGILISRIGPHEHVLKIRPPLVIEQGELDQIITALDGALLAESDVTERTG